MSQKVLELRYLFEWLGSQARRSLTAFGWFRGRAVRLERLRAQWGHPVERERDFDRIGAFYHLAADPGQQGIDDKTWRDLEYDRIYARIECCESWPGRQYLYRMLRVPLADSARLGRRFIQYGIFLKDRELREKIQFCLGNLSHVSAAGVAGLLYLDLPEQPRFAFLFNLSSAASLICLPLILYHITFFFAALAFAILNIVLNGIYFRRLDIHSGSLAALNALLQSAERLAGLETLEKLPQIDFLRQQKKTIGLLRRKIGWLMRDRTNHGDLISILTEYLNLICLFDLLAFVRSLDHLKENRDELRGVFDAVGSLDAGISVTSWLSGLEKYCRPVLNDGKHLEMKEVYHPLIEVPVANSIRLEGESLLITGSNMAGKTTFIKTVGINVLLARTLHVCLAAEAVTPRVMVMSSIERDSGVGDRKSSHLAEIERLNEFIRLSSQDGACLFLIDEIFHGTNTLERVSAAGAVLGYLGSRAMLLVTTHDLELAELLTGSYRMCHFSEVVEDGRFFFDYHLKPGPCNTRNAIRLLELENYPPEVVAAARTIAGRLSGGKQESGRVLRG